MPETYAAFQDIDHTRTDKHNFSFQLFMQQFVDERGVGCQ